MDSSPSKRRKTSPTRSIPIDASNSDLYARDKHDAQLDLIRRASFMSPTKASLSRFNPDILAESRSAGNGHRESDIRSPRRLNPTPLRPIPDTPLGRLSASPIRELSLSPSRRSQSIGDGLASPARRRSHTPGAALPQREPSPDTIVLAPANRFEQEIEKSLLEEERLAQAVRRSARRTRGNRLSFLPTSVDEAQEEPDLPPTPEQLGLGKRPSPPEGLLESSTSAKALKRKDTVHTEQPPEANANAIAKPMNNDPTPELEEEESQEIVDRREKLAQCSAQFQSLQSDIAVLEDEVQRSRDKGTDSGLGQPDLERLLSILTSTNPSNKPLPSPPAPPSLTKRLTSFLPFSKRRRRRPSPQRETSTLPTPHLPIDVPDPLPHLQAFTPFEVSSSSTFNVSPDSSSPLLSSQALTLRAPTSNLAISLNIVSNTETETVESLNLENISPWAGAELGSWIKLQVSRGDVSAIGWGCSRYHDVANIRARCWASCEAAFPQLARSDAATTATPTNKPLLTSSNGSRLKPKPKHPPPSSNPPSISEKAPKASTLALQGRQTLTLTSPTSNATLLFTWHIGLDWIGEIESRVWVTANLPAQWTATDERQSLDSVPEAFRKLLGRVGVEDAIRLVVRAVFGEDEGVPLVGEERD